MSNFGTTPRINKRCSTTTSEKQQHHGHAADQIRERFGSAASIVRAAFAQSRTSSRTTSGKKLD